MRRLGLLYIYRYKVILMWMALELVLSKYSSSID
jgi:hypothetical protein